MGVSTAIVEKDFWVCWMLDYLFSEFKYANSIFFKGGTSLSKAYHLISRFSEDVDLIIDWEVIGFSGDMPYEDRSNTKQALFNKVVNETTEVFLKEEILPILITDVALALEEPHRLYIDELDMQTICFEYPRAFEDKSILQVIRLEIGALAESIPSKSIKIISYVEEYYPKLFNQSDVEINTVSPIRTFFEKLTILHREAHRLNGNYPKRYSRHYYDTYKMINSKIKDQALLNLDLLFQVVKFKKQFYSCKWANYDDIFTARFKLIPNDDALSIYEIDYNNMKNMLYDEYPSFDLIVKELKEFETIINNAIIRWQ